LVPHAVDIATPGFWPLTPASHRGIKGEGLAGPLCQTLREFCSRFWNHHRSRPRRRDRPLDFECENEEDTS
jgi:hypothetical protein